MKKFMYGIVLLLIGFLFATNCYALKFSPSPWTEENASARVEIIRDTMPNLGQDSLAWLGGELSYSYGDWVLGPRKNQDANWRYRMRVRLWNVENATGKVIFGEEEYSLNDSREEYRTYYPESFYSWDSVLENMPTNIEIYLNNETEYASINIQLDETWFPDKAEISLNHDNQQLNASNIDAKVPTSDFVQKNTAWNYEATWTAHNGTYYTLDNREGFDETDVTFDYSNATYNKGSKYFYDFYSGWAHKDGYDYRTYQRGVLADKVDFNMYNSKLSGEYFWQKFGQEYSEFFNGRGVFTSDGQGTLDWHYDTTNTGETPSGKDLLYYATDLGTFSFSSFVKGAIVDNGLYGLYVEDREPYNQENINFLVKKSSGLDNSSLQGEYTVYNFDYYSVEGDVSAHVSDTSVNFDGSGSVSVPSENYNATYKVSQDGSLTYNWSNGTSYGQVAANGEVFTLSNTPEENDFSNNTFLIGIKKTTSFDEPSLSGTYYTALISYYEDRNSVEDLSFSHNKIQVEKNGTSIVTGLLNATDDTTTSYNMTSDGDITISTDIAKRQGRVNKNKNIIIATNATRHEFMVAIRASSLKSDEDNNGIDDSQELSSSSNMDLNNNGVPDVKEMDEKTKCFQHEVENADGNIVSASTTIKSSAPVEKVVGLSGENQLSDKSGEAPNGLPRGLYEFSINVNKKGGNATVEFYLDESLDTENWFKYGSDGWNEFPQDNVTWEQMEYENNGNVKEGTKVILDLEDGGVGDADGLANGVIHDPSGPAILTSSDTDTDTSSDSDSGGGGCVYSPSASGGWGWMLLLLLPVFSLLLRSNEE